MLQILSSEHIGIYGTRNIVRAEIAVSGTDELTIDGYKNFRFADGSIAWDKHTGNFYALDGGIWYKQDGSGTSITVD